MAHRVTAAIVGVILNLSASFTVRTLFRPLGRHTFGPLHFDVPIWSSWEPAALAITAAALLAMLRFRVGLGWSLLGSAAAGLAWRLTRSAPAPEVRVGRSGRGAGPSLFGGVAQRYRPGEYPRRGTLSVDRRRGRHF